MHTSKIASWFAAVVGDEHVLSGDAISEDYTHDEALTSTHVRPAAVLRPQSTAQVAAILRVAHGQRVPVTARGAGTGLSGGCAPRADGIVVASPSRREQRSPARSARCSASKARAARSTRSSRSGRRRARGSTS